MGRRVRSSTKIVMFALAVLLTIALSAVAQKASAANLYLGVTYTEEQCGEPMTFTLTGYNGSGNYQYRLGAAYQKRGETWEEIIDSSQTFKTPLAFSSDNTIEFTFYASGTYYLNFYVLDSNPYGTAKQSVTVTISDADYPDIETVADNIAAECLKTCITDYDKALWLHDWLIDNMSYDNSFIYCGTEGALVRGEGTCNSYRNGYVMLLERVGVECGESIGNGHIWTAVKMDGEWYQIDTTWDDPTVLSYELENHLYFGITDELMATVHNEHKINENQRSAHYENNYFIKSGKIRDWTDPIAVQIQTELDKGSTEFTVSYSDAMPISYRNIYYDIGAWELSQRSWTSGGKCYKLTVTYEGDSASTANNNRMTVKASLLPDISWSGGKWEINKNLLTGESNVVVARYDTSGRMLSVNTFTADPAKEATCSGEYDMDTGSRYRIFLLSGTGTPLCELWDSKTA